MRDFGVYPAAHSAFLLNLGLEPVEDIIEDLDRAFSGLEI